jgi:hypothetical protein
MSTEFGDCAAEQRRTGVVGPYGNCAFLLDLNDVDVDQNGRDAVRAPRARARRLPRRQSASRSPVSRARA